MNLKKVVLSCAFGLGAVACGGVDDVDTSKIDRGTAGVDVVSDADGVGSLKLSGATFSGGFRDFLFTFTGPASTASCIGSDALSVCNSSAYLPEAPNFSFANVCPGDYEVIAGQVFMPGQGCAATAVTGDNCTSGGSIATISGGLTSTLDVSCGVITGALDVNIDCSSGC
ncbi:MAG: hypothetical protein HY791_33465 [Deltaproteobacteria bacterium]|nr:hypothetical protein [Deltaproteobacteria bacterium]